jgi:hypothetical protein
MMLQRITRQRAARIINTLHYVMKCPQEAFPKKFNDLSRKSYCIDRPKLCAIDSPSCRRCWMQSLISRRERFTSKMVNDLELTLYFLAVCPHCFEWPKGVTTYDPSICYSGIHNTCIRCFLHPLLMCLKDKGDICCNG